MVRREISVVNELCIVVGFIVVIIVEFIFK